RRLEAPLTGRHDETAVRTARRPDRVDAGPADHGQAEPCGGGLQIVAHLATARIVVGRCREAHAGQPVIAGRAVQPKRVPMPAPMVTDARIGVEDHESHAAPGEVVAGRQPGLSGPDDDRVDPLGFVLAVHSYLPRAVGVEGDGGVSRSPGPTYEGVAAERIGPTTQSRPMAAWVPRRGQ